MTVGAPHHHDYNLEPAKNETAMKFKFLKRFLY